MTTANLIDELKRSLGNRADITDTRYVRWLNWAIYDVCGYHRKRAYPARRFHFLENDILFNSLVVVSNCSAATSTSFTLAGGDQEIDDYYNDMVAKITGYTGTAPDGLVGQIRLITDYVNTTNIATIAEAWTVTPDTNTECTIYRRKYSIINDIGLNPQTQIFSVQMLEIATSGIQIKQKNWKELTGIDLDSSLGIPGSFARRGNSILFNKAINEVIAFRLFYYRLHTLLDADSTSAECELPDNFEEVIVSGATYRGFAKLLEPDRANQEYDKYIKRIVNTMGAYSIEESNIVKQITVQRGDY